MASSECIALAGRSPHLSQGPVFAVVVAYGSLVGIFEGMGSSIALLSWTAFGLLLWPSRAMHATIVLGLISDICRLSMVASMLRAGTESGHFEL